MSDFGQLDVPPPNTDFVAIAAGTRHSMGLKADGSIVVWGTNDFGKHQIPQPNERFVAISAGGFQNLAIQTPLPQCDGGDVNCDGIVNVSDLLAVISAWGPCAAPPLPCPADVHPQSEGDGVVNVNDLLFVITNWS